jgi:hypothetical protein
MMATAMSPRRTPFCCKVTNGWYKGISSSFPRGRALVGLHAGYKLTRLEGRYDDITLENTAHHTAVPLNGGDDNFFQTTYLHKQWFAPFVDAAYGNAVFQAPGSFDVFATQDALIARPTG